MSTNSISDTTENAILALVFNATAWTAYAINHTTTPETSISVGLHTADPGDAGTMATTEAGYGGYTRMSTVRTSGATGWTTPAAGQTTLGQNLDFPSSSGAGTAITWFSTGKVGAAASAMPILWAGDLTPSSIAIGAAGVIPRLTTATTISLN